jgi:hypothetical protein
MRRTFCLPEAAEARLDSVLEFQVEQDVPLGCLAACRRDQVEAAGGEFRPQRRAPVAAVAQGPSLKAGEELERDRPIGLVGGRQRGCGDQAGPSDAQVQAQPVVGLVRKRVVSERGQSADARSGGRGRSGRPAPTGCRSRRVSRPAGLPARGVVRTRA